MRWFGVLILLLILIVVVLAVNRPPHIHIQPTIKDIYYKPGESVELPCVATGIPLPTYFWKRNGKDYNPSALNDSVVQLPGSGTIVLNRSEDKGVSTFQCFADNGYGVSASVTIYMRQAKLARFAYEERQTHTAQAGEPLTLPCDPPPSYPSADLSWVLKESDSSLQPIKYDKRINMDLEGRLRFTNVQKSDEKGGSAYLCMATNNFLRDNVTGPEHVVSVYGNTEQKKPTDELWTSPTDQVFLKGQTLNLMCIFSGNPAPDVFWKKTGGHLPDRAKFKSFGQTLEIVDLQLSDAGEYVCEGFNTESFQLAIKGFTIRIDSSPYWIDEPKSQDKRVNESATFICRAGGIPEPKYVWYINGVPFESVKDPRIARQGVFIPNANNLTMTGLTLEDYMVIQCNASNKYGYVFADFSLNVISTAVTTTSIPTTTPSATRSADFSLSVISTAVTTTTIPTTTPSATRFADFSLNVISTAVTTTTIPSATPSQHNFSTSSAMVLRSPLIIYAAAVVALCLLLVYMS